MTEIVNMLRDIVLTAGQALLILAVCYGITYLTKFLKDRIQNEKISAILDKINKLVKNVVIQVSQTYVDELKKNDGFNKEAQAEAFNMAMTEIKQMMTDEMKEVLQDVSADADAYLTTLIETNVKKTKDE